MTVQTVKLGRQRFVILAEKDYRQLKAKARPTRQARPGKPKARRLTEQDLGDVAEATRRLRDPAEKPVPYEQVRKQLGLA